MKKALYVIAWLPVALGYALALATGNDITWPAALTAGLSSTIPAAVAGLAVILLCHRVPLRERTARATFIHVIGGVAFTIIWSGAIVSELWLFQPPRVVSDFLRNGLVWQLVTGLIVYAVLAGGAYARIAYRGEEEHRTLSQQSETLRLRAELSAVRARLDPHFLFNVLQTLNALIEERPRDAQRALEHLGALLSRRLREGDTEHLAGFSDELADVREYLALESLRLGDRLRVEERIDPETKGLSWPRFTLQPLVENAIHHGIAPRALGGSIVITSAVKNGQWCVSVADDGRGGDSEGMIDRGGIGLRVVRDRLHLHFGDRATLEVHAVPGEGCTATVCIEQGALDDE